jgi:hypothetical protein
MATADIDMIDIDDISTITDIPETPPHTHRNKRSHSVDNMSVDEMGIHGEAWVENPCGFGGSQSFTDDANEIKW